MSTEELIVAAMLALAVAALMLTQVHRIRIRTRSAAARERLVELVSRFNKGVPPALPWWQVEPPRVSWRLFGLSHTASATRDSASRR
jgi:hypothetical protein